jgi:hypothetical protein
MSQAPFSNKPLRLSFLVHLCLPAVSSIQALQRKYMFSSLPITSFPKLPSCNILWSSSLYISLCYPFTSSSLCLLIIIHANALVAVKYDIHSFYNNVWFNSAGFESGEQPSNDYYFNKYSESWVTGNKLTIPFIRHYPGNFLEKTFKPNKRLIDPNQVSPL